MKGMIIVAETEIGVANSSFMHVAYSLMAAIDN